MHVKRYLRSRCVGEPDVRPVAGKERTFVARTRAKDRRPLNVDRCRSIAPMSIILSLAGRNASTSTVSLMLEHHATLDNDLRFPMHVFRVQTALAAMSTLVRPTKRGAL